MRHLNRDERLVSDSEVYSNMTYVDRRANKVRLQSDKFTPLDGTTLTLAEWHLLSMKFDS